MRCYPKINRCCAVDQGGLSTPGSGRLHNERHVEAQKANVLPKDRRQVYRVDVGDHRVGCTFQIDVFEIAALSASNDLHVIT